MTGVPLRALLESSRLDKSASEVIIEGSDSGVVPGVAGPVTFSRSLSLEKALAKDTIVAFQMNGSTLSPDHGYPARLVATGWYGMASVKWVTRVRAVSGEQYRAFFNGMRYVYVDKKDGRERREPVTEVRVKSMITHPADGDAFRRGSPVTIRGNAWSGSGGISTVEVDHGTGWEKATIGTSPKGRLAWVGWRKAWVPDVRGETAISVRATDERGNTQPLEPMENRYQYGYNAIQRIHVKVS